MLCIDGTNYNNIYEGKRFVGTVNAWTILILKEICASNTIFSDEHSFMELTS